MPEASSPLELEVLVIVRHLTWVLGIELQSSASEIGTLFPMKVYFKWRIVTSGSWSCMVCPCSGVGNAEVDLKGRPAIAQASLL